MSNNDLTQLIPLGEYLLQVFNKFISSKNFAFNQETTKQFDGSLTLINYKPMVASSFETSPGYMPFVLEISIMSEKNAVRVPEDIEIKYGEFNKEKTIHLNLGNVINTIHGYGFLPYEKHIKFSIVQGAKYTFFVSDIIVLFPKASFGKVTSEVEAKVKTLIQALESANPEIRNNFYITYAIYTSSIHNLYPHIILIPKGIINDISDFLLSQYKQIYGDIAMPEEFIPNEEVDSPELVEFLSNEKLPLEVVGKAVRGTYGSYPALLLPEGDYSQYLKGNERVINLGKNVLIVFGNPQGTPQPQQQQPQQAPATQAQGQQNKAEQNVEQVKKENDLEKILNIELSLYIPDWLKFYLNKYGVKKGESLSRQEREVFAEKVWNELQKNWNKILELLDVKNASILPTTALALVTAFPSEGKGSKKKVVRESEEVIEQTKRSILSDIFEKIRTNILIPLEDSFAPDKVLDLRILRPVTQDEFERFLNEMSDVTQLYKDAYLIFSFVNSFENKSYEKVNGTANLKEASPEKLAYLQDINDAYERLKSAGIFIPLIVDKNNTLLVGSLKDLSPNLSHTVLKLNDLDLNMASKERLKELKSFLNFTKEAFDDQYGAMIIKVTINPSALDIQAFKTIVELLGICSEDDEVCLYKARQELSAFPETLKDKFIENLATKMGRNPTYRIQLINLFATLFALVNYYDYLSELKKEELKNYAISKLRQEEEEKAKKILEMVKQGFKIS